MNDLRLMTEQAASRAASLGLYARQWVDAETARDVVQQALAAMLSLRTPPDDAIAWMYRAVRNAAIDQLRSASARRRREEGVALQRGAWFTPSPHSAIDAESAQVVLEALPAEQREIVVLRIWGDLGFAQIGRIVGLSVSAVQKKYTAALRVMRAGLEKPCRKTMP